MDYGTAARLASCQLMVGGKGFGRLAGWVQPIGLWLGAGAKANAQIGYPTRSPKKVFRVSILRIGVVRFLVPNMFLEFCCCDCITVDCTLVPMNCGTTV